MLILFRFRSEIPGRGQTLLEPLTWFGWAHDEAELERRFCRRDLPGRADDLGCMVRVVPRLSEVRIVIVTDVGCGMRWTLGLRETSASQAEGEDV